MASICIQEVEMEGLPIKVLCVTKPGMEKVQDAQLITLYRQLVIEIIYHYVIEPTSSREALTYAFLVSFKRRHGIQVLDRKFQQIIIESSHTFIRDWILNDVLNSATEKALEFLHNLSLSGESWAEAELEFQQIFLQPMEHNIRNGPQWSSYLNNLQNQLAPKIQALHKTQRTHGRSTYVAYYKSTDPIDYHEFLSHLEIASPEAFLRLPEMRHRRRPKLVSIELAVKELFNYLTSQHANLIHRASEIIDPGTHSPCPNVSLDPDVQIPQALMSEGSAEENLTLDKTLPQSRSQYLTSHRIQSERADMEFERNAGVSKYFEELNSHMNLKRDLKETALFHDIQVCCQRNFDFGTTYALLRTRWEYECCFCEDTAYIGLHDRFAAPGMCNCCLCWYTHPDTKITSGAADLVNQNTILHPYNKRPRRMWDILSNRIVPVEAIIDPICMKVDCSFPMSDPEGILHLPKFMAISHTWAEQMGCMDNLHRTRINQQQWDVPLPQDANANAIFEELRTHLFGLGAQYCWLDVLCLRQIKYRVSRRKARDATSGLRYDRVHDLLRSQEWATDVPTIGNIYQEATSILAYLDGLGTRWKHSNSDWTTEKHWLNRTWTMQETHVRKLIIAELPKRILSPLNLKGKVLEDRNIYHGNTGSTTEKRLRNCLISIRDFTVEEEHVSLLSLTSELACRFASNEVDKITALSYLLHSPALPQYNETEDPELAWAKCVSHMSYTQRLELLFNFPEPRARQYRKLWENYNQYDKDEEEDLHVSFKAARIPVDLHWLPCWHQVMWTRSLDSAVLPLAPGYFGNQPTPEELQLSGINILQYNGATAVLRCTIMMDETQSDRDQNGRGVTGYRVVPDPSRSGVMPIEPVGFYYPWTVHKFHNAPSFDITTKYTLISQGAHDEVHNRAWLVCRGLGMHELGHAQYHLIQRLLKEKEEQEREEGEEEEEEQEREEGEEEEEERQWANWLILQKVAVLMTDDAGTLIGPKNLYVQDGYENYLKRDFTYDVLDYVTCYFV